MTQLPQGFQWVRDLGSGKSANVCLAQDEIERLVAVKLFKHGADFDDRQDRETHALAGMAHKGIVTLFQRGDWDGRPFLVLEYVSGGDLRDFLKKHPASDPRHVAKLVIDLAKTLAYAHHRGIIHRDLKPANVLLTDAGLPKIADFGTAKRVEADETITVHGDVLGTPSYMAPEQARGDTGTVGAAADIYGLGAILYEMLTGRPPFKGATQADTLEQVLRDEPVAPRKLRPAVPRDLETICLKCLAKGPGKRYLTAQALADDLGRFLRGEPILARRTSIVERAIKTLKRHPVRSGLTIAVAAVIALTVLAGWEFYGRLKAQALRDRLLEATTAAVPGLVDEMAPFRHWVEPLLREAYAQAEENGDALKQLHLSLGLLPGDPGQVEYLHGRLLNGTPQEVTVIRDALFDHKQDLTERLWVLLEGPKKQPDQRLRAACALAIFARNDSRWEKVSGEVAAILVVQKPPALTQWTDALKPVGRWLLAPLADFLVDEKRSLPERGLIARIYGAYAAELADVYDRLEQRLAEKNQPNASLEAKIALAKRQASIGAALMVMGREAKVWSLLKHRPDPTVRSFLIERLGPAGVDPDVLAARLKEEQDVSVKRAILLSLGEVDPQRLSEEKRQSHVTRLLEMYEDDPDPGIHGAARWLLQKWEASDKLKEADQRLLRKASPAALVALIRKASPRASAPGVRQWYVHRQGHTMVVIRPKEFWMGHGKDRHRMRIPRSFAIASRDVTVQQFLWFPKYQNSYGWIKGYPPSKACPANNFTWFQAGEYCNWLSDQEGLPPDQWCYQPDKEGKFSFGMKMAPDYLRRTGYRMPTEAEWEYACQAGAETGYSWGLAEEVSPKYAWFSDNSSYLSHPVGVLKPNDFGLFDMHGNLWKWTQSGFDSYGKSDGGKTRTDMEDIAHINYIHSTSKCTMRGGGFDGPANFAKRSWRSPQDGSEIVGFRVARTISAD